MPEDVIAAPPEHSAQNTGVQRRPGPPGAALESDCAKSKSESGKQSVVPFDTAAPKETTPIVGTPVEAAQSAFATGAEKTERRHFDEGVESVERRESLERPRPETSAQNVVTPLDLDRDVGNLGLEAYSPLVPPSLDAAAQLQSEAATLANLAEELAEQRRAESTEPPTVHFTIGRVEVRAIPPAAPRPAPTPPPRWTPALSLDEYLKQRNEGQR
jgi:hypothetical protein